MGRDNGPPVSQKPRACIVCGAAAISEFLDLGSTALANKLLSEEELNAHHRSYRLAVGFCNECTHVQLTEFVPPAEMFEDYLYVSSASTTLKDHLYDLSDVIAERRDLGAQDLVMDIGANDGTLLKGFSRYGVRTLAVDPAMNLAALSEGDDIARFVGFFNSKTADEIVGTWGRASIITATNTFPHIPELHDFMDGIEKALAPGGTFVIEAHYVVDLLEQVAFDTVYHEHVSYWALKPMIRFFGSHGFEVVDAEHLPIHHGQLRVWVQRKGTRPVGERVGQILEMEREKGIDQLATFEAFSERTAGIRTELTNVLTDARKQGKTIVGYGAPAKANTLMSYLKLGPDLISYVVDRSLLKQGRYIPDSLIPIRPVERLLEDQPDYLLLLAWNFTDEIMEQQAEYLALGGRVIIPLPEVQIV